MQDLLPIRYHRMAESAFGFYRGAAGGMAADLAKTPSTGFPVQLCGDAHLLNFGTFATPERRQIFDVNDFDETLTGPWEWDLKRLAGSIVVAARARGETAATASDAVVGMTAGYRHVLDQLAAISTLERWYWSIDAERVLTALRTQGSQKMGARVESALARAQRHDNQQALAKLTEVVSGRRRFVDQLPLIGHVSGFGGIDEVHAVFEAYRSNASHDLAHLLARYDVIDAARKVVGVGSVGTRCWIVLLDGSGDDDSLILQVKEAQASVLEPWLEPTPYDNHGRRVVEGQRLTQAASDLFLGWTRAARSGVDYYWRQLRDMKLSADLAGMGTPDFGAYAVLCGATMARAHARSGDVYAILGYIGTGDVLGAALARFAQSYADQNELDHAALVQAVTDGVVPADSVV